jgi:voltage-gated potassium channel
MTYERWDRLVEWPLAVASIVFLAVYAWLVIGRPGESGQALALGVTGAVWLVFAIDYVVRLRLVRDRRRWFVRNLHLLALVVLPFFRPLHLLRLVALLGALGRVTSAAFRGRVILYVVASTALIVAIGSLAVLDAEQDAPGALITTYGDALWWAMTTVTTVGYGDLYPITIAGRVLAVFLMLTGLALVGAVTATLASWFVERVQLAREAEKATRSEP